MMSTHIATFATIFFSMILVNNYVLVQFLGICPFLGVSKKLDSSAGMGAAVIVVMVIATAVTFPLQIFLLDAYNLGYLQTIIFILVIAVLVQLIEITLKKYVPALYQSLGDCTRACKFDAIHVINGVAVVDRKKCTGCTACTVVCPRHVIQMKPIAPQPAVKCSNKDKGALVNKTCKVGCIACGLCVRNCPNQAIFLKDNVAVIDYTKCNGCGTCVSKCPKKAIQWVEGVPRSIDAPVPEHEVLKTRV